MLRITFEVNDAGKIVGAGKGIDASATVNTSEISAMWQLFGEGGFEHDARWLLEKLCFEKGFDSSALLKKDAIALAPAHEAAREPVALAG